MEADSLRRRRADENFVVWSSGAQDFPPRLSVVVRRQFGSAVRRNRIKRRLRAAFGFEVAQAAAFRDFVIVAKPATASVSFAELRAEIARAISSAPGPTGDAPR